MRIRLIASAILLIVVAIVATIIYGGAVFAPPPPNIPTAKLVPTCAVPNVVANIGALGPNVTGGVYVGPVGQAVTIPANVTMKLTQSLTIISSGNLDINGHIVPGLNAVGEVKNPSLNITLISQQGSVNLGPNAVVGWAPGLLIPTAAPVTAASSAGNAGRSGGYIKIVAPSGTVWNQGSIIGLSGEGGGSATDVVGNVLGFMSAAGGGGGHAGDVRLCHVDGINNQGTIRGGFAGGGGGGIATSVAGLADARGGPGGLGGDVILEGLANPGPVRVLNPGGIFGGLGGEGGGGIASTAAPWPFVANADGARGRFGGTVKFVNVEMAPVGPLHNASGGDGGVASATGGPGLNLGVAGTKGGSATAKGGRGARDGVKALPIPVPPLDPPGVWGPTITGLPSRTGTGGTATATAGGGGFGLFKNGASGTANAVGGTGKGGVPPAPVPAFGPTPPVAAAGGAGGTVTATGSP